MKIHFARHGETEWNALKKIQGSTDIDLNENGIQQAAKLAESLKNDGVSISQIYTSTQKRAVQTAHIVSETLHLPVIIIEGIQEMNLGLWEGKTWVQVEDLYPSEFNNWLKSRRYTNTPNGESYQNVAERLFHALNLIFDETNEDVLIITHGAVILTLLCLINDTPFETMSDTYKVSNASAISFDKNQLLEAMKRL